MFDLSGRTVVVTGASGGIGKAIAKELHAQGATILISGTKTEILEKIANDLGERVYIKSCNLSKIEEVEALIPEAETLLGKIDIIVCNAGITRDTLAMRMKNEDFSEVIQINLNANFILNRAAIKHMIKNRYGRIINISSIVGVTGNLGQANYAASKGGLVAMSKSLALEVASRNITVNCIAPGFIVTPMTEVLTEEQQAIHLKKIPLGRFGTPEDIAYSVVFLASEESSYITGQTIHINGGMLMT
ncbi:3-oxoacyl-[acyl-carrier-protein] reductase FabG [Rickettsiales bacterium Ac37b]|nr:3-oxoacyl-[acyl-carrier-protein] reductase FabG [Rickettsiales bacterium Ac37b]